MLPREIGADGFPVVAAIRGFEEKIRCGVENVRIDRRKHDRLRAVGAEFRIANGNRRDVLHLPGAPVILRNFVAPGAVNDVGIERVRRHVTIFNRADRDANREM